MSHKPDPNKNVHLTIDGIPVTVPEGTRILEAAKKVNINIPVLCEHPDLCKRALCRICVVECDGRGKLAAACANDVWEGVKIVTINQRLVYIRKTIIEMILANHPQDCLNCIRNQNCELQSLAQKYGIVSSSFENEAQTEDSPPVIECDTIVRDMVKCVKCARCVEACQEVQTIRAINTSRRSHEFEISTPYKHALKDISCVFCGKCASVCPVGAIYGYDQSAEVQTAINDTKIKTIAQVSPSFAPALNKALALAERTITTGKMIAAIKLLGFDKVYDAEVAANIARSQIYREIQARKNNAEGAEFQGLLSIHGILKRPLISGCSQGVTRFINSFYPDLADDLTSVKSPRQIFAGLIKQEYAGKEGLDPVNVISVSFVPCIAQKYTIESDSADFALTAAELARMIKMAGIAIETLPEERFPQTNSSFAGGDSYDTPNQDNTIKKETVRGYAKARNIMEAILKNEYDMQWVEILSCSDNCCS
ncbi:MAG: 2Fe-2S iron-sulfur cluster-binding protein [Treponema sp.]|nr:2Fe-2S iron-sulfur cluster-binding protein [Treponema sp.]